MSNISPPASQEFKQRVLNKYNFPGMGAGGGKGIGLEYINAEVL